MSHGRAGRVRGRAASRWLWVGSVMVLAGAWSGAAADDRPTCSTRNLGGHLVYGSGRIEIPVPPARVYEAVTDYVHLPEYVTAMDSCTVLGRDSLGVLVQQMGMIKVIVSRPLRMTLRFKEEPPSRLWFEIVAGDFSVYYGVWEFERSKSGTLLEYTVTMRPPTFVPTWLVRPSIERTLCRTLVETRQEAERREALAARARATEGGSTR